MDWFDQYLDGMGEYKVTVSPADTHQWGPAKPSKQQLSMIQDAMAFDIQQRHLIQEAREQLERHGASREAALGIGADPGSPTVQLVTAAATCTDAIARVTMTGYPVMAPTGVLSVGRETYNYNSGEFVIRYETDAWIFEQEGTPLASVTSTANWPWLASWPASFEATKTCPQLPPAPGILDAGTGVGYLSVDIYGGGNTVQSVTAFEYRVDAGDWIALGASDLPAAYAGLYVGELTQMEHTMDVRGVGIVGTGPATSYTVYTGYLLPVAPDGLDDDGAGDGYLEPSVVFNFDDNRVTPTSCEYRVDGGEWIPFAYAGQYTTFNIPDLTNNVEYDIDVQSINPAGTSPTYFSFTGTPRSPLPDAPTLISASNAGSCQVQISYSAPAWGGTQPIEYYEIQYTDGVTGPFYSIGLNGLDEYTDINACGKLPYETPAEAFVAVRACNVEGCGEPSNMIFVNVTNCDEC